jgi:hypothetical protein
MLSSPPHAIETEPTGWNIPPDPGNPSEQRHRPRCGVVSIANPLGVADSCETSKTLSSAAWNYNAGSLHFSSQITTDTANEVLLEGSNCGPLNIDEGKDPVAYDLLFNPYMVQRVTAYSNYAQQCYMKNATAASEDCHPYVQTSLKATSTRDASCPFASEMCKSQTENLIVDTGLIDSSKDLGINAPPENRFQMRFVHHCAPVVTEGYSNVSGKVNSTGLYRQYWYGSVGDTVRNSAARMLSQCKEVLRPSGATGHLHISKNHY